MPDPTSLSPSDLAVCSSFVNALAGRVLVQNPDAARALLFSATVLRSGVPLRDGLANVIEAEAERHLAHVGEHEDSDEAEAAGIRILGIISRAKERGA